MKRFKWRLERVLEIKKKQEQKERTELLELTERLAERRAELLMRLSMLKEAIRNLADADARERLCRQEFFLKHATVNDEQISRLSEQVAELESQQRAKIAEVLRIRRFREGLEKLRAEAKRQFVAEQEKLDQKELDETATISFVRKALT